MLPVLFLLLFLIVCGLIAPWLGADSSDARREDARPDNGWYPPLIPH